MNDVYERARSWADSDPDPETARQIRELIDAGDTTRLEAIMGASLEFGTAGIRGEVGPGTNRMNRAVVIRTTRGLCDFLLERSDGEITSPVIVGRDARPSSRIFAEDTVGVIAAAGIPVRYFEDVVPTPLVAFAAKHLHASAAVVITASHNPPRDNGYKVYDSNAAQIISPTDSAIAAAIESVGSANDVPRIDSAFTSSDERISAVDMSILDSYWDEVDACRPQHPDTTVDIVYTPLHGVGAATLLDVFGRTVHRRVTPVPAQAEPDGTFPTVEFPNPEEPGALDLALALASESNADLVLGNDPDADRLAAAVPDDDGWRLFTGNELGVLLGSYLLEEWAGPEKPITACSVVSSPMLGAIAAHAGAVHLTTLTGFKWIANAALQAEEEGQGVFLFGYEEALGYTVGRTVRDKDGISAALLLADIASIEGAQGRTLLHRLGDLWNQHGIWVSTQRSITRTGESGAAELLAAVDFLGGSPPDAVHGMEVTSMMDYRVGADERSPWLGAQDLIELGLGDSGRVLVRPSGTEPKLKIYVDLRRSVSGSDVHRQRDDVMAEAERVATEVAGSLLAFIDG